MTSELDFKTRQEMGKNIKKGSQGRNRRSRGKSPERANRTDRGNSPDRGNNPEREVGVGFMMGGTHVVYLRPAHVDVLQKPSEYYKVIILQLK